MADYSPPYDPAQAALARQRREAEEREAYRTGFKRDKSELWCLGCGCLIFRMDDAQAIHRKTCHWTPKVPKTIYVEEGRNT